VPGLIEVLDKPDAFARYAGFTALNRIGRADPTAWPAIVNGLGHPKAAIRECVGLALRETWDERLVAALAWFARDKGRSVESRSRALGLLAGVARRRPAWKGEWWAYHPALGTPPAKSESWAGTKAVLAALCEALEDTRPAIRLAGVEGLREANDRESAARLRSLFRAEEDPAVRRAVLLTLGSLHDRESGRLIAETLGAPGAENDAALLSAAITAAEGAGGEEVAAALERHLTSDHLGPDQLRLTITALGRLRWVAAATRLVPHARSGEPKIRQAALEALVRIGGESGRLGLLSLANDADPEVRRAAVTALGDLKDRAVIPTLLAAHRDARVQPAALAALAHVPDLRALDAYLEGLGGRDATLREACRQAITALRDRALPAIEAKADRLSPEVVVQLRQVYESRPTARRGRLFALAVKATTSEVYFQFARSQPGDTARGRRLFHDRDGLGCVKCHRVGGEGNEVGPDLSGIGAQFDRERLAESVLYPSRAIREGYQTTTVATADGRVLSGLVRSESAEALVLRDNEGRDHEIHKADIEQRKSGATSLMPEGLQVGLTLQDFADLISYLESLRAAPEGSRRYGSRPK
jgi:putative heme-binding domain-containing protein